MSIYDKTGHIDQLTEWWENAEEGVIEKGDTVINRSDSVTTVYVATVRTSHRHPNARILSRAPKPKPAWHDAVAVIASTDNDDIPRGFIPQYDIETGETRNGYWSDFQGDYEASDLIDPVPLIEAKVTDEMITKAREVLDEAGWTVDDVNFGDGNPTLIKALNAALGLEIK